jgi:hypothetical protein
MTVFFRTATARLLSDSPVLVRAFYDLYKIPVAICVRICVSSRGFEGFASLTGTIHVQMICAVHLTGVASAGTNRLDKSSDTGAAELCHNQSGSGFFGGNNSLVRDPGQIWGGDQTEASLKKAENT